ncbi:MAG TPA: DUF3592 domain-containing protein [Alphaproteobacteria bacterium]|nr:DUF3592 domain-containing protein [Alphaproteobacteria bacterium]
MKFFSVVILALFLAVLAFFVTAFGYRLLLRQHLAESFPHVQGTVISSQVTITHSSRGGVSYHVHIAYRYSVDGVKYIGYRYRYDGHPNDSSSANTIVNSHPPGSVVDVFYNPDDPTDVLLSPGVDVTDVALSYFMTGIVLFPLWAILNNLRQTDLPWGRAKAAGGLKLITDMLTTRLRLPRYQPLSLALLTTSILTLLSAAAIALGLLAMPPWPAGELSLAIVIIGGAGVYVWQYMDVHSGKRDLVIDEATRTVQLPLTYGRREQLPISFSQIRSVFLNKVRHQTKSGVYYTYMVTLRITGSPEQKLINLNLARAESLAAWLRQKLGIAAAATDPDARAADV